MRIQQQNSIRSFCKRNASSIPIKWRKTASSSCDELLTVSYLPMGLHNVTRLSRLVQNFEDQMTITRLKVQGDVMPKRPKQLIKMLRAIIVILQPALMMGVDYHVQTFAASAGMFKSSWITLWCKSLCNFFTSQINPSNPSQTPQKW